MPKPIDSINDEVIEEKEIDLSGFEYVTKGYFPHTFDPAINFRPDKFYCNQALVKKLSDVYYVHLLINQDQKRIIIKPCDSEEKDAIKWASEEKKTGKKRKRDIKAKIFCAKIYELMNWNPEYRYKVAANIIKMNGEFVFVLELTEAEATSLSVVEGRKVYLPERWRDSFGTPFSEHDKYLHVQVLDGFARIEILSKRKNSIKPPKEDTGQLSVVPEDNKNGQS